MTKKQAFALFVAMFGYCLGVYGGARIGYELGYTKGWNDCIDSAIS